MHIIAGLLAIAGGAIDVFLCSKGVVELSAGVVNSILFFGIVCIAAGFYILVEGITQHRK